MFHYFSISPGKPLRRCGMKSTFPGRVKLDVRNNPRGVAVCGFLRGRMTMGEPPPERPRGWYEGDLPDRFTIDKPGKCEVRCERRGRR